MTKEEYESLVDKVRNICRDFERYDQAIGMSDATLDAMIREGLAERGIIDPRFKKEGIQNDNKETAE